MPKPAAHAYPYTLHYKILSALVERALNICEIFKALYPVLPPKSEARGRTLVLILACFDLQDMGLVIPANSELTWEITPSGSQATLAGEEKFSKLFAAKYKASLAIEDVKNA